MFYNTFSNKAIFGGALAFFRGVPALYSAKTSADSRPVNVAFAQSLQLTPEDFVFGLLSVGVGIYHTLSHLAHVLQELPVAGNVRNFQVEGNAALLGALQVSGGRGV